MTEVLAPITADRHSQQPSLIALKHLVWKDVRTFGLPAAIFIAAYLLMTLIAYVFAPTAEDFAHIAVGIIAFAVYGLAMLWATAAGAIITAADREDGTDTWMRSLPVAAWKVYLGRVFVAYLSVAAIGLCCTIGILSYLVFGSEDIVQNNLGGDPLHLAQVGMFFATTAAFLASGLIAGTVTGRVMAGVLLGAMLPIVALSITALLDFPNALPRTQNVVDFVTLAVLAGLVLAAIVYSGWAYVRAAYPQWVPSKTTSAGSWRRKLANLISPTRQTRSLVSRELHAIALFLPIAFLYLLLTLLIHEPVGWYVLVMFVPWAAGLAMSGSDGRDDTLPFLTHRGLPGVFVWTVKNVVWGLSVAALLIVFFSVVEHELVTPNNPDSRSWRIDSDQGVKNGPPTPSAAMATLYASAESRLTNSNVASVPKRQFIVATAATLGLTLFLLGQIAGFWCRRKVVAMAVSLLVCIPWMFLHSVTAAFETPGWAVNAVPLVILIVFAARAGVDAVNQQSPWLRRGVIGTVMLCAFVLCVRTSRLNSVPDPVGGLAIQPVSKSPEPTAETSLYFDELAVAMKRPVGLPRDYPVQLGSGGSTRGSVCESLDAWAGSPLGPQFFDQVDREGLTDEVIASRFESRIVALKRFAEFAAGGSRMPSRSVYAVNNIVDQMAVILLVDATLKWHRGDEVGGWDSWTDAWVVADYFAEHDGEWSHSNVEFQISPTGKVHADAMRLLCLNVLLDQLGQRQIPATIRSEIYEAIVRREPEPRRELANAAYRVLLDHEPDSSAAYQRFGLKLLDFYLAGSTSQVRAELLSVALLQRYADYGEQRGVRLADIAAQYGLSPMDVKRLGTSTILAELDQNRPSIWPFLRVVDEAERNIGHRHSDLMMRYQDALRELERRGGTRDVVELGKGVEPIPASPEK